MQSTPLAFPSLVGPQDVLSLRVQLAIPNTSVRQAIGNTAHQRISQVYEVSELRGFGHRHWPPVPAHLCAPVIAVSLHVGCVRVEWTACCSVATGLNKESRTCKLLASWTPGVYWSRPYFNLEPPGSVDLAFLYILDPKLSMTVLLHCSAGLLLELLRTHGSFIAAVFRGHHWVRICWRVCQLKARFWGIPLLQWWLPRRPKVMPLEPVLGWKWSLGAMASAVS